MHMEQNFILTYTRFYKVFTHYHCTHKQIYKTYKLMNLSGKITAKNTHTLRKDLSKDNIVFSNKQRTNKQLILSVHYLTVL